jgi:hypothetical protein
MSDDLIPDELRDFILKHFDSIAQLEALLLLRTDAHVYWSPDQLAKRLYIDATQASAILAQHCSHGFFVCTDAGYRFQCDNDAKQRIVDLLAGIYSRHIVPVTNIVHSKPPRIQEFADAFRLKKDKGA